MTINIVIVNWNSSAALKRCLSAVLASVYDSFRVIVVDNASNPAELSDLKALEATSRDHPVFFLYNSCNDGYAGGNNAGFRYITASNFDGDILVLNPDVQVAPDTLSVLAAAAVGNVGIVTPRVVHPTGRVLFDGIRLHGYRQRGFIGETGIPVPTDFAQGTCMLIQSKVLEQIGFFDERFFLYWEEVDLSIRAKSAGFQLVCVNETSIVKDDNPPSRIPTCFYYSVRNANLLRTKYPSEFSRLGYALYVTKVAATSGKLIGNPALLINAFSAVLQGFKDAMAGRYGRRQPT